MTALFAGTVLINDGLALPRTKVVTNTHDKAPVETVQEPNYQEQLAETRGELENADNKYMIAYRADEIKIKFSSKNSVNLIPVVGVSIKMFDIYAGAWISYNQIKYSQVDTRITDPDDEDFNDASCF